jgi:signal transduction histidine kinase
VSFRTRLFLAIGLAVVVPLVALAYGVRREMDSRLTREYRNRVASMVSTVQGDLARESSAIATRLRALASDLSRDNRFRLAVTQADPAARRYLLDYASLTMRPSGFAMLQIQDSTGRILSSGHFRNQFDRLQPGLPQTLARWRDTLVVLRTRTPEATLLALARIDSLRISGRQFYLVGGPDASTWSRRGAALDPDLAVALTYPGVELSRSPDQLVLEAASLPYLDLLADSVRTDRARLVVTQSSATLDALRRSVNRWLIIALGLTLALATIGAAWLSSRISRPLRELAGKTAEIDLDRLDQNFETNRRDEIGALSRLLGAMTDRLRASSARLREAERRAAVGDLARQVTHDIKNGLTPIRNVLRHLSEVLRQDPSRMASVFEARRGTLESSVEYLDTLARNYDRLSPGADRRPCDVNTVVEQVLRNTEHEGIELRASLADPLPSVLGDSLTLRRVLENLVGNALDSVTSRGGGEIIVRTESLRADNQLGAVRITVADTGTGMSRSELDRAFDDFYTTKPGGSGLGLSIVRRMILDLNGTLRVETEPGVGTRVMIELPAAPAGDVAA